jgi:hypothetical protein
MEENHMKNPAPFTTHEEDHMKFLKMAVGELVPSQHHV